jgi:hypothetical protein
VVEGVLVTSKVKRMVPKMPKFCRKLVGNCTVQSTHNWPAVNTPQVVNGP